MRRTTLFSIVLVAALAIGLIATQAASAQGPVQQPGFAPGLALACSTTDYTDIAAKALGMTASDLRVALVSGKTLQDLATSKNVPLQTVTDALQNALKADLDQAAKDGLIPQQAASAMNQGGYGRNGGVRGPFGGLFGRLFGRLRGMFGNGNTTPAQMQQGALARGVGFLVSRFNVVRPYVVAAQAINMSCADLVKALENGGSIVQVATSKNVQAQTVIDALMKAYRDAYAQDVKEGLITQAQADARTNRLVERVTAMISRTYRGFRGSGPFGPFPGQFPPRRGQPNTPQQGTPAPQGTPPATGTPSGA